MYALINLPGSSHFEYFGPASEIKCNDWLESRVNKLLETELLTSTLPRRIVSNKEAEAMRFRDGSKVCKPQLSRSDLQALFGQPHLPCGCPGAGHVESCPGFGS